MNTMVAVTFTAGYKMMSLPAKVKTEILRIMQPPYHRYLFPAARKMILLRHKKSPRRKASGEYCRLYRIVYYHLCSVGKGKEKKRNRQIFRDNFWYNANI